MNIKAQETLDAELLALAALASVEAVIMAGDNQQRVMNKELPAWRSGCGYLPATTELSDILYKRGYKL